MTSEGFNLVKKILKEEVKREELYPVASILDKLEKEFGDKASNILAEKVLGKIFDKKELAEKFIEIIPLYYDNAGIFWIWDLKEMYWKIVDEIDVLNWVDHNADANVIGSKERNEILNALKMEGRRRKPEEISSRMIQFGKEIINLETGDRFPSSPKVFATNPIPFKLGKSPDTLKFDKLFEEWVGKENVLNLYEVLGYCMLSDYPIERIVVLHGAGSNGKSCFLKILRTLIGQKNICSTSLDRLTSSNFEVGRLYKKLACEMGETNLSRIENTQIIKRLVSGKDLIPIEFKFKNHIETLNYAKLIIATNNLPPTEDKTDGFYRRWLIIDFPNRFEKEIDILKDLTTADYENLAAKCLIVLDDLLIRRSFSNEGGIDSRRERYEDKSNPLEKFWKENIDEGDPNSDIPCWEFEKKANIWMKENKFRSMSDTSIARFMKHKGVNQMRLWKDWFENKEATKKQFRCWGGIKWK